MATARARVSKAVGRLITSQPFYGTLALHLEYVETDKFPTMATDGKHCWFNPKFVGELADDEVMFVIAHEVGHCAYNHHTRRRGRDPKRWNRAGDYVINATLIQGGVGRMPSGKNKGLRDYRFDALSTEEVYAILEQEEQQKQQQQCQKPKPQPGQGQGEGEGQGSGEPSDQGQDGGGAPDTGDGSDQQDGSEGQGVPNSVGEDGGFGEVLDAPGDATEVAAAEREWQTITQQAVNVASKQAGSMPGHLMKLVTELKKPVIDWRDTIRRFLEATARFDYTWARTDRRFATAPFILPGTVKDGVAHAALAIDTSGSIFGSPELLAKITAEVQAALDLGCIDKVTLIHCDTRITKIAEYYEGDTIPTEHPGGGGTSFAPVMEWLKDQDVSGLIYFTDLFGDFGEEPAVPVMWAAYGQASVIENMHVPFGEVLHVSE